MNPGIDLGLSDEPGKEPSPRVSVVLAAYNSENYICDAIESILGQTYEGFELIVVDDGSSDRTSELLDGFGDQRIVRLRNEENLGVAVARNRGGAIAKGEFIAVHDADDLSMPERFERQVAFLDENPEIGVVGTQGWLLIPGGRTEINVPQSNDEIQARLIGQNCMHHSSLMIRASVMNLVGGYDESYSAALDLDLVLRLAEITALANLPDKLYVKRSTPGSISNSKQALDQKRNVRRAIEEAIDRRRSQGIETIPHKKYALSCLAAACAEVAFGKPSGIDSCIRRALEVDKDISDSIEAARVISNYSINYALESESSDSDPLIIITRLFQRWPDEYSQTPLERKTRALTLRNIAFTRFREEKWAQVVGPATKGFVAWPTGGNNRGLLSVSAKAIVNSLFQFAR